MSAESDFQLCKKDGLLTLIRVGDPSLGAVSVDFDDKTMAWRQRYPQQPEALLKASGVRAGQSLRVIDATAGLGQDAFMLAHAGCNVLMLERSLLHGLLATLTLTIAQSSWLCSQVYSVTRALKSDTGRFLYFLSCNARHTWWACRLCHYTLAQ